MSRLRFLTPVVLVAACAGLQKPAPMKTYEKEAKADPADIVRKRYPDLVKKAEAHHQKAVLAQDEKEEELLAHHANVAMLWWRAATTRSHADDLVTEREEVAEKIALTGKELADAQKQEELAKSAIARAKQVIALQGKMADSKGGAEARDAINAALAALKDAERVDAGEYAKAKFDEAESKLKAATEALGEGKTKKAKSLAEEAETVAASAKAEAEPKYAANRQERDRTAAQRELFDTLSSIGAVNASIVEGGVQVTIVGAFEHNSVDIKSDMQAVFAKIADAAKAYSSISLVIEGHTDSKGKSSQNLQLSDARANSVMSYLASKGVAPGRMSALGKGSAEPVAENKSKEGRAKNRRIEILFATPGM